MDVKISPYTLLYFLDVHLKPYGGETQRSLRSGETDSDRQNRGLTVSSVSITLNSLHIIQHRPGTGDRQRAPVTSPQRRASFSASFTEQCTGWQAAIYQTSPRATTGDTLIQCCLLLQDIFYLNHVSCIQNDIWIFYFLP